MAAPCIFFQQGRCRNGGGCRFSHSSAPVTHPPSDPRAQVPCKFYLEGICKQGDKCPYQHKPSDSPASAQASPQRDNDTFIRVFRGALVRYGDGACVNSLSLPSEYSSVRLDNLAANTTAADVISVLEDLGHDIEIDGLRIVAMPHSLSSLCSAYISTPDLEFSKTLSASLIDAPYRNLKAMPVPPRLPSWASTRRARCNKLKLKWTSPRSECYLSFSSYATALRVCGKFNGGKYKVCNTRIHCDEPFIKPNSGMFSVVLSGLPYRCTAEMVEDSITADYDLPQETVVQRRRAWKKIAATSIKELLDDVGPIDFMTEPYEHNSGLWTAYAHFEQDCDAQEAARVAEERSHILPYDVNLKVTLLYSSTFKVSKEVYHHIQRRLEDCLDELDAPRLIVTCRETCPVLSLDSRSSEELAKCANAIEEIVAGDVIMGKDGNPFWVPQLACNGPGSKVLKEIQKRHEVLLLPNRSKREVRCFGDTWKQSAVQEDVVRSLTEDPEIRHAIDIDNAGFIWLCKVGLSLLKDVVGDKVVSLNVTADPKKLVITGSDEEYCQILALLEINDISFAVKEAKSEEESCSICFTPADEPVVLGCGHTYCTDCFKGLCKNGTTQADVSVACTGAEDKCKNAIPLREIQAHVDISTFEQLLESSFNMYIARRPDEFHYCPTPDCGYIYRPTSASVSSSWHMCTKCLQRICRSCHANHEGQRCEQYQATQAFETYKRENRENVKDCPRCKTTVEKIDGCNHIECGGCKIHLCWVCLQTFEESRTCYRHMTEAHGGIGIDDEDDDDDE